MPILPHARRLSGAALQRTRMPQLIRSIATVILCGLAVFAADVAFRRSMLDRVRPLILQPAAQAVVRPPVTVAWDGPEEMRVYLRSDGNAEDIGLHRSPMQLGAQVFPREGGYELELRHVDWPQWIYARQQFQMHFAAPREDERAEPARENDAGRFLYVALDAARKARDKARLRIRQVRRENADLRDETARLAERLEIASEDHEIDLADAVALEDEFLAVIEELQIIGDENLELRFRLANVNPCTVWGYYGIPRPPITIPPSRRVVRVSNLLGEIFRTEVQCESARRADTASESPCFCVGDTWGQSPG